MIIDDNEINRELLKNIFENSYKTEEAENGREGLEKILDHAEYLSAILLDVVMPEMDGIEVMRELNARGVQKKVPVFLITADPRDEIVREAYSLGVMDVIGKPVVPYVVKRRVDSVVELFEARKKAFKQSRRAGKRDICSGSAYNRAQQGHDRGLVHCDRVQKRRVRRACQAYP